MRASFHSFFGKVTKVYHQNCQLSQMKYYRNTAHSEHRIVDSSQIPRTETLQVEFSYELQQQHSVPGLEEPRFSVALSEEITRDKRVGCTKKHKANHANMADSMEKMVCSTKYWRHDWEFQPSGRDFDKFYSEVWVQASPDRCLCQKNYPVQVNIWKIIHLNCGEWYEDTIDHRSLYTQLKQLWN